MDKVPYPCPVGKDYKWGKKGAVCPRCHVFITTNSTVRRLPYPEEPRSTDGRKCNATDEFYYASGQGYISLKPRWFVHSRCW